MEHKSVNIGGLVTRNNVFLAPLAGYTNAPFRQMCSELGAGLTFTEMVSAKGLVYGSEKTRELLNIDGCTGIQACQLFGAEPEFLQRAAESEALAPFDLIDINMGCPMPKIYRNGEGSALLENMPLAASCIAAVKKSGKRVSVKFRIGIDEKRICGAEFARMCEEAGADMITVHGRTRDKIYSGRVNFEEIARCKAAVKIPVIANGGVFGRTEADKLMERTGADGIAIARGAMYRPWIFSDITGRERKDKRALVLWQLQRTRELYGERFALVYMRKMAAFYVHGEPNAAALRTRLFKVETTERLSEIIEEIF